MKYIDGTEAKIGDIIRWNVFDLDDNHTWSFVGLYRGIDVVYLCGGLDAGMGIGKFIPVEEVLDQAENNDEWDQGVTFLAKSPQLAQYLREFEGTV
jgi:hypothetical protein